MNKKTLLIASFMLIFSACASKHQNNYLISDNSIGKFRKNLTLNDLKRNTKNTKLKKTQEIGEFQDDIYTVYKYYDKNNNDLLEFIPEDESLDAKVDQIVIISPLYKTKDNIGVNSTFKEVKNRSKIVQALPDIDVIHIEIEKPNLWLIIDKKDLKKGWWNNKRKSINIDKIPEDAKIKYIIKHFSKQNN